MTTRWGICGTGGIAEKFVAGLALVDDAEVVAVGSRTTGRSEEFARSHGIERSYPSYESLAADEGVDIVYVATTQEGHRDATVMMLAAGRHVLCEKPLAMSEVQALEMVEAAGAQRRFLMEAMWSRFSPAYSRLGELIDAGCIGAVMQVRADLSVAVASKDRTSHRLWDAARGGGALLDVGIYPLQLASLLLGPATGVHAGGVLSDSGVDRRVAAVLDHHGGELATISAAIDLNGGRDALISGSEGSIAIEAPMHAPSRLVVRTGGEVEVIECGPPGLHLQVPEVHRCLGEGLLESPVMPWAESLSLLRTADEIRSQLGQRYPWE